LFALTPMLDLPSSLVEIALLSLLYPDDPVSTVHRGFQASTT